MDVVAVVVRAPTNSAGITVNCCCRSKMQQVTTRTNLTNRSSILTTTKSVAFRCCPSATSQRANSSQPNCSYTSAVRPSVRSSVRVRNFSAAPTCQPSPTNSDQTKPNRTELNTKRGLTLEAAQTQRHHTATLQVAST